MNSNAEAAGIEGRERKEMGRLVLEMLLMYELAVGVSEGMVPTRMVKEKLG